MRRQFLEIGVLTLAIGVATVWLGWWTVPLVGGGWGVARRGEGYPALTVAVSASLAWVLLLAVTSLQGPVGDFASTAESAAPPRSSCGWRLPSRIRIAPSTSSGGT